MKKILIVDDSRENSFLLQNFLKSNNYEAIAAADGFSAVTQAEAQKPDLIIMDMMMPSLSGADTARLLKASSATGSIPIIFLSGLLPKQEEHEVDKMMDFNGTSYVVLSKPFDQKRLLSQIQKLTS